MFYAICLFLSGTKKSRSKRTLNTNLWKAELYLQKVSDLIFLMRLREMFFSSELTLFYSKVKVFNISQNIINVFKAM